MGGGIGKAPAPTDDRPPPPPRTNSTATHPGLPLVRQGKMEQYRGMTDEELISTLKKYSIPHGPVVGSTRKLYERKIYEVETEKIKHSPQKQSYTFSDSESPLYESKRYDVLSREGRSGSSPAYQLDQSDSQFCERQQYDLPRDEERKTSGLSYQDKGGDDYYTESYSSTKTYGELPVRQRLRDDVLGSANTERKYYSKENAYQNLSQYSSSAGSSSLVEPRRGIREKPKVVEPTQTRSFFPLWLQFLLLLIFIGFLAFVYFFVQPENENPFEEIPN